MSRADRLHERSALIEGSLDAQPVARQACTEAAAQPTPLTLHALFTSHYASIWRLLRRLGVEPAQLDDAAQEVFWIASRRLSDIRKGREHAFLYGVALRVASHALRKRRASPPTLDLDSLHDLVNGDLSPEEHVLQQRARRLLDVALDRLSPELRAVFVLFELEGLSVKDIAALEEIPVGTASSRLRRAREEFSAIGKRLRHAWFGRGEDV